MKTKDKIKLGIAAFFYGMKGGEKIVTQQKDSSATMKEQDGSGVFKDILEEKETDEVKEMRDKYYRVLRESFNYRTKITGGFTRSEDDSVEPETLDITAMTEKIEHVKPEELTNVLQTKGWTIKIVQEAILEELGVDEQLADLAGGKDVSENDVLWFKVKRDFTPKFLIEKYIKKAVVKQNNRSKKKYQLDLYFSKYTRQFYKIDSLFIAELTRIFETQNKRSEMFDIEEISFITNKAYGMEPLHDIICKVKSLEKVSEFDGNYVVTLNVDYEDVDMVAKFKTDELTEKYAVKAPKKKEIDADLAIRIMEEEQEELKKINENKTE